MSWQTLTGNKGLGISVIKLSQLEENTRIDAEYYLPEYLIPYRTGLVCKPIGSILSKCQYGISKEMNEDGLGIEIYRMNELEDGLCKDHDLKFVDIDEKTRNLYYLKPNDILFNRVNSIDFVGRTAIYKHEDKNRVFASYLVRVNTDEKIVLPDYLNIFLNCKYGKKELKRKARWAVNQANINAEELKRIVLPIAPMSIQQKIEFMVNKSHSLIGKSRNGYTEAEQLLLNEINLDGYRRTDEKISIRNIQVCVTTDRLDAEYWQPDFDVIEDLIKKHKDGFDVFTNLFVVSDKKTQINPEQEYLYSELADVNKTTGTIDNFTNLKGKELPSRGRMSLKKDDIIVSTVEGSLDKIAIVSSDEKNIIGSTGFFVLRQKDYEPEVAIVLLKSKPIQMILKRQAQGTILTAIPKSSLNRIILPKINNEIQLKVKDIIINSHKDRQEAKILLEKAKRAVEIFIEENEEKALNYIKTE